MSDLTTKHPLFDTSVGKSIKTFLWTFLAYAAFVGLTYLATSITNTHWNPALAAAGVPGLLNWAVYTAKVLLDPLVPTTPSSEALIAVPKSSVNTVSESITTTAINPVS